ncbi:hypothetical protein QBC47DRAFT_435826 [Echria macrotheca]|uniref:Uncharacterized protein n=1 Tax=Echria macrotheca TaxID=438768 RepID=A0AAJ0B3A2_9PEZI|nr:hypothetical protein QBC47DRAFT_435826 [Echria macrotheca]
MIPTVLFSWVWTLLTGLFSILAKCLLTLGSWALILGRAIWRPVSLLSGSLSRKLSIIWNRVPAKRPPLLLTQWGMALQLSCQAGLIVTIYALIDKSRREKGVATVGDSQSPLFDSAGFHPAPILSSSIVWTTVPAWIISAYSALWSAMLDDLKKAHATLELRKWEQTRLPGAGAWCTFWERVWRKLPLPSTFRRWLQSPPLPAAAPPRCSTAKKTLLLDYGEWPVLNGIGAIFAGHTLLGLCLILRAALWTAGGLSAAIFATADVPFDVDVQLYSDQFFDQYLGSDAGSELRDMSTMPAFDLVSATVVRDGPNYPWTTDTHSFLPFYPATSTGPGNYTFDTEAYWATVECNIATEKDLAAVNGADLALQANDSLASASLRLHYSLDGCDIDKSFLITNNTLVYGRSWSVTSCSQAKNIVRFGMVAGTYDSTARFLLSNFTAVTCKPLLYRSNVTLQVSIAGDPATTAQVVNFTETSRESFWPFFAKSWFSDMPYYSVLAPVTRDSLDALSRLVLSYALGKPLLENVVSGGSAISESFGTIFQALFSNYVTLQGYHPAPRRTVSGTLARVQTRLFVAENAAFAVLGIVAAAFAVTLVLAFHLFRNRTILAKHLDLMFGDALLFHQQDPAARGGVSGYVEAVKTKAGVPTQTPGGQLDVDLVSYAKRDRELGSWAAWVDRNGVLQMMAASPRPTASNVFPLHPLSVNNPGTGAVGP